MSDILEEYRQKKVIQLCKEAQAICAESSFAAPTGLDDALVCLKNISKEYQRFCDVMLTMPERRSELKAGSRFMDGLENLRDELLKRKSSNAEVSASGDENQKPL